MIESIDNAIQLLVTGGCACIAVYQAVRRNDRMWALLSLFYGTFFLGDLYWCLYLVFFDDNPKLYIAEFSWYTSYLFLLLLLIYINVEHSKGWRYRFRPLYMLIVAFTGIMCVFFIHVAGDYISNIIAALLMTGLIWHACFGLQSIRKKPEGDNRRMLYVVTLLGCATEYAMWTSSCFWMGESITNIYYLFDLMLSACIVLLIPALRKAVDE